MSASFNLHSADGNSVIVRSFADEKTGSGLNSSMTSGFASVSVSNIEKKAEVILYFANLAEVENFCLVLKQESARAIKIRATKEKLKAFVR